jgi:hypothetical protein
VESVHREVAINFTPSSNGGSFNFLPANVAIITHGLVAKKSRLLGLYHGRNMLNKLCILDLKLF